MIGLCSLRFPVSLTREPLVGWDHRPLAWWSELLAAVATPLLFLAMFAVFELSRARFDR